MWLEGTLAWLYVACVSPIVYYKHVKQFTAIVTGNDSIAKNYYELSFAWPNDLLPPLPGQFLELRCADSTTPLLRRPFAFSAYDRQRKTASFIYEVRGIGTELIAKKRPGDSIDTIAPLGNGFASAEKGTFHILVSGGVGLGPIRFLARSFKDAGEHYLFIHGVREASFIPVMPGMDKLEPVFCTDDGSAGFHGRTTEYLDSQITRIQLPARIYACGPLPMLKACHRISETYNLDCVVSMEQIMGCGFGACMGCVIRTTSPQGFSRVCEEGPIFPSREIIWT
jgi:dihydroorotate dehydrogenase electron transfer subunit